MGLDIIRSDTEDEEEQGAENCLNSGVSLGSGGGGISLAIGASTALGGSFVR